MDDLLVALYQGCDPASAWTPLTLRRTPAGTWAAACDGTDELVELRMADMELAGMLTAIVQGKDYAPSWPDDVTSALSPWPLTGRGTLVFDSDFFLEHLSQLLEPGNGPVLLLDGAARLGLASATVVKELQVSLSGLRCGLAPLFLGSASDLKDGGQKEFPCYEDLLNASEAVRGGKIDLTRACRTAGPRRTVHLDDWPFGFEHVQRTWRHGMVLRELEPGGVAESAGCRCGDIVTAANGRTLLDATLSEVDTALRASPHLSMEVEQPLIEEPFYLREATPTVLLELAGPSAEQAAREAIPQLTALLADGNHRLQEVQHWPKVFAGDEGSASWLHADTFPRVQFCHVVHGVKLFAVERDAPSAAPLGGAPAGAEVSFPADAPLDEARAAWLASPGVSLAACRPGDVLCFWGGDRHSGTNAMSAGPCVALFNGYRWEGR